VPRNCCKIGGRRRYEVSVEPRVTRNRLPLLFFWPTNAPYVANVDSWYRLTERRAPLLDQRQQRCFLPFFLPIDIRSDEANS